MKGAWPLLAQSISGVEVSGGAMGYYALCMFVFMLCGLIVGFFIWRKGNMLTQDAEAEVRRTEVELERLQEDLQAEAKGLEVSDDAVTSDA